MYSYILFICILQNLLHIAFIGYALYQSKKLSSYSLFTYKFRDLSQKSLYLPRRGLSRRIKWMQFVCSCRRYFRGGISEGGEKEVGGKASRWRRVVNPWSGVALCMGSRDTRNNGSTYTHAGRLYRRGHIRRGKLTAEQFQWGLVTTPAVIVPTIIIYCCSMVADAV